MSIEDVRMLVVEEKTLPATYVTLIGFAEPFQYQLLDVDSDGNAYDVSILSSLQYQEGVRTHTGYLRIERDVLDKYIYDIGFATSATPAPVVAALVESDKQAPVNRGWITKKAALIAKHSAQWPTANRDFQDAIENGLSKAAKAPGHGEWYEADALNWANQRGKLIDVSQPAPANSIFNLGETRHKT
jgi:hypothetical protein